jgi:hypothetical protein
MISPAQARSAWWSAVCVGSCGVLHAWDACAPAAAISRLFVLQKTPNALNLLLLPPVLCLQLYNGVPGLQHVRNFVKGNILQQCGGAIPRLKPDLPPQVCATRQCCTLTHLWVMLGWCRDCSTQCSAVQCSAQLSCLLPACLSYGCAVPGC